MRDAPAGTFNWTRGRATAALVLAVTATAGDAAAQGTRIARNRWTTSYAFQAEPVPDSVGKVNRVRLRGLNGYLAVVGTAVQIVGWDRVQNAAGIWAIHPGDQGYVRFRNDLSGTMLHYEQGFAQVGPIQAAWWSAMWTLTTGTLFATSPTLTPTTPTGRLLMSNRWKSDVKFEIEPIGANPPVVRLRTTAGVLSISNGSVGITAAPVLETTASSSQWFVRPLGSAPADCTRPDCFFQLYSITMAGALHNETGALVVGPIQPDWHSAMWTRGTGAATPSTPVPTLSTPYATTPVQQQPPPPTRQLMSNRWRSDVRFEIEPISLTRVRLRTTAGWLTLSDGRVGITSAPVTTTTSSSSEWQVIPIGPAPMDCARPDCFFRLSNPAGTGVLNNETGALVVGQIRDDWYSAMWIRGSGVATPSTFVPAMPATTAVTPPQPPPATGRLLMTNRWKSEVAFEIDPISLTRFRLRTTAGWLTVTNGRIGITAAPVTPTTTSSSEWLLQPIGSATVDCTRPDCFYRLMSPVGSGYLNNETGGLLVGQINNEWYSAMWIRGPGTATPSTFVPAMPATTPTPTPPAAPKMLANRWRSTSVLLPVAAIDTPYVHLRQVETDRFLVMDNRQLELVTAGYGSHLGMWRMEPVPGESFVRLRNRITGDYVHIESGSVGVGQVAAGTFKLEWHSGMWTVVR